MAFTTLFSYYSEIGKYELNIWCFERFFITKLKIIALIYNKNNPTMIIKGCLFLKRKSNYENLIYAF